MAMTRQLMVNNLTNPLFQGQRLGNAMILTSTELRLVSTFPGHSQLVEVSRRLAINTLAAMLE